MKIIVLTGRVILSAILGFFFMLIVGIFVLNLGERIPREYNTPSALILWFVFSAMTFAYFTFKKKRWED